MTATTPLLDWVITGADGLEDLLLDELKALGAEEPVQLKGAIAVRADLAAGYRFCLCPGHPGSGRHGPGFQTSRARALSRPRRVPDIRGCKPV